MYKMVLRLKCIDERKFRYERNTCSWTPSGRAKFDDPANMEVVHHDWVNTGPVSTDEETCLIQDCKDDKQQKKLLKVLCEYLHSVN